VARGRRARLGVDEHVARDRALRVVPKARRAALKHYAHHTSTLARKATMTRRERATHTHTPGPSRAHAAQRGSAGRPRAIGTPRPRRAGAGAGHAEARTPGAASRGGRATPRRRGLRREGAGTARAGAAEAGPRHGHAGLNGATQRKGRRGERGEEEGGLPQPRAGQRAMVRRRASRTGETCTRGHEETERGFGGRGG
jgi:hypothetical protein